MNQMILSLVLLNKCKEKMDQNNPFDNILNIFRPENNKSSTILDKITFNSSKKLRDPNISIPNMSTTINGNQRYFSDYNAFTSIKLKL